MKINVGPEARIVGMKRVSPAGTVKGLQTVAGRDVFIVVPTGTPRVQPTTQDLLAQLRSEVRRGGKRALKEVRTLRRRHLRTHVPGTPNLLEVAPSELHPTIRKADSWVRAKAERLERRLGRWLAQ